MDGFECLRVEFSQCAINKRANILWWHFDWLADSFGRYLIYAWCVFSLCHIAIGFFSISLSLFLAFHSIFLLLLFWVFFSQSSKMYTIFLLLFLFTFYFKMIFNFTWGGYTKTPQTQLHPIYSINLNSIADLYAYIYWIVLAIR